jgi:polysaccharide deacetylase family protein (PEP-CTERM system associated)
MVHRLTPAQFAAELDRALDAVQPLVSQSIIGHRAPYFSIDDRSLWALPILQSRGFRYDSSFFPARTMLYGYPGAPRFPFRLDGENELPRVRHSLSEHTRRATPTIHGQAGHDCGRGAATEVPPQRLATGDLVEFPVSTAHWLGANCPIGGGFYVRALPYSLIRSGIRQINRLGQPAIVYVHPWELDTGQRFSRVTLRERVTHYHGRRGLQRKLDSLLEDFPFTTLRNLLEAAYSGGQRGASSS